jgi:hypothetical protein
MRVGGKTGKTSRPVGTLAFMSPEANRGTITTSMDVFAMGVTLLELVTGAPAEGASDDDDDIVTRMEEALEILETDGNPDQALAFIDTRISPPPPRSGVTAVLEIAIKCLRSKYKQRPDAQALRCSLDVELAAAKDEQNARQNWVSSDKKGMDTAKLFEVVPSSSEHAAIVAAFIATMPRATIDRLERVENGLLHESFQLQAASIQKCLGGDYNASEMRQLLFHGTHAVGAIVHSTDGHGFLPLLAGSRVGAIYGNGSYFARNAKYSHDYAHTLPNGQKQMLVVDVLLGRWAPGCQGMSACPFLPGEQFKRYNSLVDRVPNPSIFVVQHSNQAYPAYVITYHT